MAVGSGEAARLAGVVAVGEELGGSIFLPFGVVAARAGCSSPAASVLSIVERFFQSAIWRAGVFD
jgi:hypothetical protein